MIDRTQIIDRCAAWLAERTTTPAPAIAAALDQADSRPGSIGVDVLDKAIATGNVKAVRAAIGVLRGNEWINEGEASRR